MHEGGSLPTSQHSSVVAVSTNTCRWLMVSAMAICIATGVAPEEVCLTNLEPGKKASWYVLHTVHAAYVR